MDNQRQIKKPRTGESPKKPTTPTTVTATDGLGLKINMTAIKAVDNQVRASDRHNRDAQDFHKYQDNKNLIKQQQAKNNGEYLSVDGSHHWRNTAPQLTQAQEARIKLPANRETFNAAKEAGLTFGGKRKTNKRKSLKKKKKTIKKKKRKSGKTKRRKTRRN
jgi:hypothetical protein